MPEQRESCWASVDSTDANDPCAAHMVDSDAVSIQPRAHPNLCDDLSPTLAPPRKVLVLTNIAVRLIAAVFAFILHILLVKMLGTVAYGKYILFTTYCSLISVFAIGGLDTGILRRVSVAYENGIPALIRTYGRAALVQVCVLSAVFGGVFELLRAVPGIGSRLVAAGPNGWMFPAVLSASVVVVALGMLMGVRKVLVADSIDSVAKSVTILVLVFAATHFTNAGALSSGIGSFITANVAEVLVILLLMRRILGQMPDVGPRVARCSVLAHRESATLVMTSLLTFVFFQFDTLVVGSFLGARSAASYNMACNFVRINILVALIVTAQTKPLVAAAYGSGQIERIKALMQSALKRSVGGAFLGTIVLVVFGKLLLHFVNNQFVTAYPTMLVLAVAHIVNSVLIVMAGLMFMCHKESAVMRAQLAGVLVCLPALYVLVPMLGQVGAAMSVLAGLLVVVLVLLLQWRGVLCGTAA